jgi:hypothetical protein
MARKICDSKMYQSPNVERDRSRSSQHGVAYAEVVRTIQPTNRKRCANIGNLVDLHEYLGGPSICPSHTPHPITGETVPLTFGHEFSGTIEEVGEGVTGNFKTGDRVCVQPIIYDGVRMCAQPLRSYNADTSMLDMWCLQGRFDQLL